MKSREYAEWLIDQLLYSSVQSIDARLGEGYHTKNPRLVCELTKLQYEEYKRQENFELEEAKAQEVSSYNFVKSSKSKKPQFKFCLLYTSPSPRDQRGSRMPSSA